MLASALAAAPGWHPARTRKTSPILTLAVLGHAELMWALALGYRFAGFAQRYCDPVGAGHPALPPADCFVSASTVFGIRLRLRRRAGFRGNYVPLAVV